MCNMVLYSKPSLINHLKRHNYDKVSETYVLVTLMIAWQLFHPVWQFNKFCNHSKKMRTYILICVNK